MTTSTDQFLLGGGGAPSAFSKDDPVGVTVTGTITATKITQQTDLQSGAPLTWDNGDPRNQLVVTIETNTRTSPDDNGQRTIYIKGSTKTGSRSLHDAVATAVRNAGAKGLENGGTLTVTFIGTEPSQTRGFSDRKLWEASYTPPNPAAAANSFLNAAPATPAAPAAAAPAAPAAAAPASAPSAETLAAFQAWQQQNQQ